MGLSSPSQTCQLQASKFYSSSNWWHLASVQPNHSSPSSPMQLMEFFMVSYQQQMVSYQQHLKTVNMCMRLITTPVTRQSARMGGAKSATPPIRMTVQTL